MDFKRDQQRFEIEKRDCRHEMILDKLNFDLDIIDTGFSKIDGFSKNQPIMSLSLQKSDYQELNELYLIIEEGVLDSLRVQQISSGQQKNVSIGRQILDLNGQRANDVILNPQDQRVSRYHCLIYYEDQLNYTLQERWEIIENGLNKRLKRLQKEKKQTNILDLPSHILNLIKSFIIAPQKIFVEDQGSVYGTYIKVSDKEKSIQENECFLLAEDLMMVVGGIYENYGEFEKREEEISKKFQFFKEFEFINFNFNIYNQKNNNEQNQKPPSIILLKFFSGDPCGHMAEFSKNFLIFLKTNENCFIGNQEEFQIKIPYDVSIRIRLNSNKQCKISDAISFLGKPIQNNYFGIWKNISPFKFKNDRYSKNKTQISDNELLKISSNIFQINFAPNYQLLSYKIPHFLVDWQSYLKQ